MNLAEMLSWGMHMSSLLQPVAYSNAEVTEDGFLGSTIGHDLQNSSPAYKYLQRNNTKGNSKPEMKHVH
jgi:hypothetical protein